MESMLSSSDVEAPRLLQDLAFLHFAMAYGADEDLDDVEREEVTNKLCARYPDLERATVQTAAMKAMARFSDANDAMAEAERLAARLKGELPEPARRLLYEDLAHVAEADGTVLETEEDMLARFAEAWELEDRPRPPADG
jgi:uncharacterized tellurite resistance protein B-like protein